jgi:glycosyltransferase involved in cell wall biosynthesis
MNLQTFDAPLQKVPTNSTPLVSVCISTYNQEKYIRQTLDSILAQKTDFPFEIVIGEDNSPDTTREICNDYVQRFPDMVSVMPLTKNLGPIPNLMRSLKACRGKYVALLDGDDYWIDEWKLQKQIDCLEKDEKMSLCFTGWKEYQENDDVFLDVKIAQQKGYFTIEDFANEAYFHTSTVVLRQPKTKEWIENLANFWIGDRPLYITILNEIGGYAYKLEDICSVFRVNNGSTFSPTKPIERSILVGNMYEELKRLYPKLALNFNARLNVLDYFIMRDAYRNKNREELTYRRQRIMNRPTKSSGWYLKCKTFIHYFI